MRPHSLLAVYDAEMVGGDEIIGEAIVPVSALTATTPLLKKAPEVVRERAVMEILRARREGDAWQSVRRRPKRPLGSLEVRP